LINNNNLFSYSKTVVFEGKGKGGKGKGGKGKGYYNNDDNGASDDDW
jgi:hypothetical protein